MRIFRKNNSKSRLKKSNRISFGVGQVVGEGASKNLPAFSSRIYHELKTIRKFLGDLHVERSLEIGCGYARLTPWIAEYSEQHCAVEPEEELFNIAKGLYPSFDFVNCAADKLPFPDNHFDFIFTWTVLQHIPPEKFQQSIDEILRVIKDDGVILMAEHVQYTPSPTTWGHTIEEYQELLKPFVLTMHEPRKVESLVDINVGEIMKFKKNKGN